MAGMSSRIDTLQAQVVDMAKNKGKEVPNPMAVQGMLPPEIAILQLFPIDRLTPAMGYLLKQDIVGKFVRLQLIQKMYGSYPDHKPDPETVVYNFLDFIFSKRFQVSIVIRNKIIDCLMLTFPLTLAGTLWPTRGNERPKVGLWQNLTSQACL